MRNSFVLVLFIAVLSSMVYGLGEEQESKKQDSEKLPDYTSWRALTPQPIRVDPAQATDCAPPRIRTRDRLGPHSAPGAKFFANPAAERGLAADLKSAMPVGATIVKEKYANAQDAKPTEYAAMIKREPGFDKEHGDWEYVFVKLGEKPVVTRGAIQSCVQCHSLAKKKDYLFRTYLTMPAKRQP